METQTKKSDLMLNAYTPEVSGSKGMNYALQSFSGEGIDTAIERRNAFHHFFKQDLYPGLDILLTQLAPPVSKKSFLVFKHNKYITVPTEKIAFFYVKYEMSVIVCYDGQEYSVNYSLEQIQQLLTNKQFFRINRQYLVNFYAIKEVEHYFARKLLVNLVIPSTDKLLVSREKASNFLYWLENR